MVEFVPFSALYTAAKDGISWIKGERRKNKPQISNEEIVKKRQEWKPIFEEFIWDKKQSGFPTDVIIRDVNRVDAYPRQDNKRKGISPWFKVGLMETYDKGVKIGLHWELLIHLEQQDVWVYADRANDNECDVIKSILIGYVPFEYIVDVDWRGDDYYNMPHIYCYFASRKREPYEDFQYCEERYIPSLNIPYYSEIASLMKVKKYSKKSGRKSPHFR